MKGADVDGRLPEVTQAHLVAALILDREADPRGEGHVAADDPMAAHEPLRRVEQVHRAALALRAAGGLAVQLGHRRLGGDAPGQRLPVLAVGADDVIVRAQRAERARRHGFLTDVEMAEPADLAERVRLRRLFFEAADQQHLAQHPPGELDLSLVDFGLDGGAGHVGRARVRRRRWRARPAPTRDSSSAPAARPRRGGSPSPSRAGAAPQTRQAYSSARSADAGRRVADTGRV